MGRVLVISEAESDGSNTSETATYKCLVSASQGAPHSPAHHRQQGILNFTKCQPQVSRSWSLSILTQTSETNFPSSDPTQSPSFCLLCHDWWLDRSVFNQRYLGPLKSWNKMFLLSITISSSAGSNEEYISSNSISCKSRKYWLTFSESDISINFHFY